jgi:uncharacterized membrane protein
MNDTARLDWMGRNIVPYEPQARAWLFRHLRTLNSSDADDLIQEAYVRLWELDYTQIAHPRAYFLTILRNLIAGPAGSSVLRQLTAVRKLPETLLMVAALTILSGIYLVWFASTGSRAAWFVSGVGLGYSFGGVVALVAFLIGGLINIPTARRIGELTREARATSEANTPERNDMLRRLAARLLWGTRAVAILLAVATAAMGVARYLK